MDALASLLPFVLLAVVFWLLLIRPQRRRQLELQATQRAVGIGDEVITGAGIVGRVVAEEGEDGEFVVLESTPGVRIKVARQAVVRVLTPRPEAGGASAVDPATDNATTAEALDPQDRTEER